MPDVANYQEYSELKGLIDSSPDAPPEKVAVARDALKRYEDQYLGGKNIAHDQSLLAPDTGPRERGESYQPPARLGKRQIAQLAMDNPQISDASLQTFSEPDAPVAPPSKVAKPPLRLISPAPQETGMSDAELAQFAMDNPQVPDGAMLGLQQPSYRSQVTAHQMPTHVGGGTEVFPDAPVSKFVKEVAPELQKTMEPLDFAAMMEQPQASKQYREWIDQTYNERSDAALARGHSAKRLPAGLLDPSYVKDAPWEERLEEGANRGLDALTAASAGALNVGGVGAGTALAGAVGGKESAKTIQESEQRHPEIAAVSGFRAAASPLAPGNLAARGINSALLAGGAKVAPKLTGLVPFIGRTAAAGTAGGLSAAGEGAARDLIEGNATGDNSGTSLGDAGKRALMGGGLGSALHIAGEGFGALNKSTEKAYEAELRDAGRVGAEPGLGGVKLAPGSPVQELEAARMAQELPSGAGVAAGRVAPKIADEGARLKAEVFERAEAETAAAYDRLARGRATAPETKGPDLLPRFSSESDPLPRFETEAMSNQLDEIGLEGTKFSPEFNPQKLAAVKGYRDPASPVEVAIYPDEGNGPIFHLSDGRHRLAVAQERGDAELEALIRHYDSEGNITSTERRMVPIRGVGPRPRPPFGDSFFPDDPARSLGPVRNLQPPHGAHPTLAPGPGDAEADAFGRIARDQGESQASLLGIQQAAKRGAHVTPDPVRVSTAPVVKHLLGILKKHNPDGGQIPFIPEDDPLRKQFPNMMRTEYVTLEEAKRRLTADPTGWIESPATGRELGMFEAPPQTVLLVTPRDLDAPSFDIMVKALDDKAKFNKELSDGDPRYKELSKAAHVARSGFSGLNELKGRQADEFGKTDQLLEHVGVQVGAGGDVANWSKGSSSQQKSVENAVKQFKQQGDRLTDDALRTVAKLGGFESELNQIPGQLAVEKLEKTMRTGENIPASDAGLVRRGYQVGRLHLYPHIKALGGTPAPEKELQAMAEAISPKLKAALRAMRVSPVARPRVQDISGLTSRIGLKGGAMGQRGAAAAEESELTEEDMTNLMRLKKAAGAN